MTTDEARTKKATQLLLEQITEVEGVRIIEPVTGSGNLYAAWEFTFELNGDRYNVEVAASVIDDPAFD